jgi:hypothetical protein
MRLWTLQPRYLDSKGLIALWREGLLAQAVLGGKTKGYKHHPQLNRFWEQSSPMSCIASYLVDIQKEAQARAYQFDKTKILPAIPCDKITETNGQLQYEWQHLKAKLRERAPDQFKILCDIRMPEPHPLFNIVKGGVSKWERVKA